LTASRGVCRHHGSDEQMSEREHHGVQEKGRFEIFEDYHLRVGEVTDDSDPPRGLAVDPTTTRRNRQPAIRIELATGDWLRPSWP
jgi:hypothetical protein